MSHRPETDAEAIADALAVLAEARATVGNLTHGDEIYWPDFDNRGDVTGYSLHTVETIAPLYGKTGGMVSVETDKGRFGCSPKHPVYLVGHHPTTESVGTAK